MMPPAAWAMESAQLDSLLSHIAKPNALQDRLPRKADTGQRLGNRNGVGILYVTGGLVKRNGLFAQVFGLTTYETLRRDLQAALDDDDITSVLLYIDSPGGEASGCDELANAIYAARKVKRTAAFVSGMACSAAYWLASEGTSGDAGPDQGDHAVTGRPGRSGARGASDFRHQDDRFRGGRDLEAGSEATGDRGVMEDGCRSSPKHLKENHE